MEKKYFMLSLEDDTAKHLAGILGNKTCKKIIEYLAGEKNASEKDIADALHLPLNTVEYNLKNLEKAKIIEKSKDFFWSPKGRKIVLYQLSNKSIIISPKSSFVSKIKFVFPSVIFAGLGAFLLKTFYSAKESADIIREDYAEAGAQLIASAPRMAEATSNVFTTPQPFPIWGWFLAGALFMVLLILILNWRKL